MVLTNSTIQAASTTGIQHTLNPAVQVPYQQKKEKAEQREKTRAEINEVIEEWFANTNATANRLAERFNKKPRYFLDIFFHGGARMLTHHEKVNPHNAFMSMKAKELREGVYLSIYVVHMCISFIYRREQNESSAHPANIQGGIRGLESSAT